MADFEYQATTSDAKPVRGRISAADEGAAREELESRGLNVAELIWCPAVDEAGSLRDEEVVTLVDAIGSAAANKLPLEVTLAALAEEKNDSRLAEVAQQVALRLQQGATVQQVLADLNHQLPTEIIGLLRAGVDSGDLAGTFARFGQQRMASQRIERRIRSAIAYPLIVAAILIPLLLFLSIYVIPMFGDMFREFEMDISPMTELILQTAQQLPMLIVGLLVFIVGIPIVLRLVGGRWLFHRVRIATPLLGRLWMWSGQREFAAHLASFLHLRLPMADAVAYTGDVVSDRNVGRACRRATLRLEMGQSLSNSLDKSIHFDRTLVALVAWGERNGLLAEALSVATDLFDDRIEQQASLLRRLLPPITLVAVATMMFFVIVSLMIPLIKLIEGLSQ